MGSKIGSGYLKDIAYRSRQLKSLADRAIAQVTEEELFSQIDEESNTIAILMKHLAGNMIHRWTDPYGPDENKPKRNREGEFEIETGDVKAELFERWESGWAHFFVALERFKAEDLTRKVLIRWREYALLEAINRQLIHYAQHVGQIIFLAKHFKLGDWESLSIPRGQSEAFNEMMLRRFKG
jgi:hypothetical protein